MKKITLMPNPYRDRGFQITRAAEQILKQHGAEVPGLSAVSCGPRP